MNPPTRVLLQKSIVPTLLLLLFSFLDDFSNSTPRPLKATLLLVPGLYMLTLLMGLISHSLPLKKASRASALFVFSYTVMTICTGIELQIFSTTETPEMIRYYLNGAWQLGLYSLLIATSFKPDHESSFRSKMNEHAAQKPWYAWIWRVPTAMMVYIVLYMIAGAIAFEFTKPYYTDPSYGLNLEIPPISLILWVQVARSFIYILALLPLIVCLSGSRFRTSWIAGLALFMLGGFIPLLSNHEWPVALRVYHTIEIFFQNMPTGMLLVYILRPSSIRETVLG